jgi:predicted permease
VPGANPIAVISYAYWERRFGSDAGIVGTTFRRLDTLFTIVGVTPRSFAGTTVGREPDIVIPVSMDAHVRGGESWLAYPNRNWLSVLGRRKPDVTLEQAQHEVAAVFAAIVAEDMRGPMSDTERRGRLGEYVAVKNGGNGFDDLRRRFSEPLTILMATVALVLLLACANIANLLLARAAARQREMAVRLAIGAGRSRVIRQLLAEASVLAFAGGGMGVVLAYGFAQWLVTTMSDSGSPITLDVTPEPRMLLFATAVSVIVCMIFGVAPAVQATRSGVGDRLAGRSTGERHRVGKTLIVVQMAISVLLLIVAGLFGRTLVNIYDVDAGFERRGVVLFSTNARRLGLDRTRMHELQIGLPQQLLAVPAIHAASVSMFLPLRGGWDAAFAVEGIPQRPDEDDLSYVNSVGPDFFRTFRTPIVAGREFTLRDGADSQRVAVVNQAFARHYFANQNPIGRWLSFKGAEQSTRYEIVGVAKDVPYRGLRSEAPRMVYMAATQVPPGPDSYTFAIRTDAALPEATRAIETALAQFDRELRPANVMTLDEHVARTLVRERLLAMLAGFFGGLSMLLSAIGVYGMMAFQVTRRRHEIGVRMALGATARAIVGMVVGQTARLTLLGCAIGTTVGLAVTGSTESILYGVTPRDPLTFVGAIAALLAIALGASYVPSHRAARTKAVEALRLD